MAGRPTVLSPDEHAEYLKLLELERLDHARDSLDAYCHTACICHVTATQRVLSLRLSHSMYLLCDCHTAGSCYVTVTQQVLDM